MPSITATPYPTRGQVLVEANFADVPGATNVCVEAVTGFGTINEKRRQLHPYVCYNDDGCLALSCGQAIFWDTEISCNTNTRYCATAINSAGNAVTTSPADLVTDTFTRTVANGWGTADTGQVWSFSGGVAANYSTNGTRGQHSAVNTGIDYITRLTMTAPNAEAAITAIPLVVSTGNSQEMQLWLRSDGTTANGYNAIAVFTTAGQVNIFLQKVVASSATTLATLSSTFAYTATTQVQIKLKVWGNQLMAKFWDSTLPEPAAYQLTATDSTFTAPGQLLVVTHRDGGNLNGTTTQWDNLSVDDVCAPNPAVTVCTGDTTIACDGCFRLGDPVRPCNDVRICLCVDGVSCGGVGGLFFAGETPETYVANSGNMVPVNSKYPINISRTRMAPAGELDVVATSFTARDALLNLLSPGGVLFWRGPQEYGISDRYIAVGDVGVAPQIADLTIQPRLIPLPFQEEAAPVGPSQGVCGARVRDLCATYATWDALIAAGVTYADILRGDAGGVPSGLATWAIINAQNADWNTLLVNEPDWNDVLDGD